MHLRTLATLGLVLPSLLRPALAGDNLLKAREVVNVHFDCDANAAIIGKIKKDQVFLHTDGSVDQNWISGVHAGKVSGCVDRSKVEPAFDRSAKDGGEGMEWFFQRYGEATTYEAAKLEFASLSKSEYVSLIREAKGGNSVAQAVLADTLFPLIEDQLENPLAKELYQLVDGRDFWVRATANSDLQRFVPTKWRSDRGFALEGKAGAFYPYLSDALKKDPKIAERYLTMAPYYLRLAPAEIQNDFSILKKLILIDATSTLLSAGPEGKARLLKEFLSSKKWALENIRDPRTSHNVIYQHLSEDVKADAEVLEAVVEKFPYLLFHAPASVKKDLKWMAKLCAKNRFYAHSYADPSIAAKLSTILGCSKPTPEEIEAHESSE